MPIPGAEQHFLHEQGVRLPHELEELQHLLSCHLQPEP